ncbi:major facilitator superfamily transporter [Colletotrichum incanum]|uniref:Major facilitator superfamily transporter n=1 Tax=Colletotrichum incanum TaxID=1573173 RepID=A0A161W8R2_COLIC|nr:major facilitator superfamily transporter [Colletotrichum incanum]
MASVDEKVGWKSMPRKDQLAILFLLRFAEPAVRYSSSTYLYYQLESLNPSLSSGQIVRQSAAIQSAYIVGQCFSSILLSKLADSPRGGRKMVLLLGTGASPKTNMFTTVSYRFLSRAFVGFTMATNLAILLSPMMGGQLADLAGRYPERFGNSGFLKTYPYAPPALANTGILLLAFVVMFFFLEETSPHVRYHSEPSPPISMRLLSWFSRQRQSPSYTPLERDDVSSGIEAMPLIQTGGGDSNPSRSSSSRDDGDDDEDDKNSHQTAISDALSNAEQKRKIPSMLPLRRIWTRNLLFMLIASSVHDGHLAAYTSLWVNFLSDPVVRHASGDSLPFRFSGGVGMAPSDIGWTLSVIGVLGLPMQFLVYPRVSQRLGALRTWRLFMRGFPIIYTVAPYIAVIGRLTPSVPDGKHSIAVWALAICVQLAMIGCAVFVTPSQLMLIRLASPHPSALARTHSIAFVTSGAGRALGSALSALVYSYGTSHSFTGLAFWLSAVVSVCVCCMSLACREGNGHEVWLSGDEE